MVKRLFYYESSTLSPYRNLATEEYLAHQVSPGEAGLYLWRNNRTVVIGRHQNAWAECDLAALKRDGVRLARRKTGGGAVYHDAENLNFTFLNCREDYDPQQNLEIILNALRGLGITAELSGRNDLTVGGLKFSGTASFKGSDVAYLHGTLMVGVSMDRLTRLLNVNPMKLESKGVKSVKSRVVNLSQVSPGLTIPQLMKSIRQAWGRHYGIPLAKMRKCDVSEIRKIEKVFSSNEWIFGNNPGAGSGIEKRFDWGGVSIIKDTATGQSHLYSDALDVELIEYIRCELEQNPNVPICSLSSHSLSQREIIRDVNGLLFNT